MSNRSEGYVDQIINHTIISLTSKKTGQTETVLNTITDEGVGDVVAGIPITSCIDDSLDTLVITTKGTKKQLFEPFDVVTFTIKDIDGEHTQDFVVGSDNLESYIPRQMNYTHVIQMVELTKILEKTKIFSLNLTNKQDTLLDQFNKMLNNAEVLTSGATYTERSRFSLSDSLLALISDRQGEDFWFRDTDLRTVVDGMLSSLNCRACVEKILFNEDGNISNIIIGYRSLNAVTDIVPEWRQSRHGTIVKEEQEIGCQDFAGKIVARGSNSQGKNTITFTDMFKTDESSMTTANMKVFFPFPVSVNGITKFIVHLSGHVSQTNATVYFTVDISSRFLPVERWDILDSENQKRYLPFAIGETALSLGQTHKVFFIAMSNLDNVVGGCWAEQYPNWEATGGKISFSNFSFTRNSPFTCTYYPQIDTAVELTKPNVYDIDQLKMGISDNQSENNLDIARHGRRLAGLIRRTGNASWYIDVEATYYGRLLPLMTRLENGFVIYKKDVAVYDRFVKCRYYLSKDYNLIEKSSGVRRQKHLFDIPLEDNDCPIMNKQYMVFSKAVPDHNVDYTYTAQLIENAVTTLYGIPRGEFYTANEQIYQTSCRINYLVLKTIAGGEYFPQNTENSSNQKPYSLDWRAAFVRPTLNYAQDKCMVFAADVRDNYSIDYTRDGFNFSIWGDGGHMVSYARYVSKLVHEIGECDTFELEYAYGNMILNTPDVYEASVVSDYVSTFPIADKTKFVYCTTRPFEINYKKDRTQRPVFFSAIECIPAEEDYGNIIIGTAFCSNNNLVVENTVNDSRVTLWASETKTIDPTSDIIDFNDYNAPTDYQVDNYFGIQRHDRYVKLAYKNNYPIPNVKSWAMVDAQGNIYLAGNGQLTDIYIAMKKDITPKAQIPPINLYKIFDGDYIGRAEFGEGKRGFVSYSFDTLTGKFALSNEQIVPHEEGFVFYGGDESSAYPDGTFSRIFRYRVLEIDEDYPTDLYCAYGYLTAVADIGG